MVTVATSAPELLQVLPFGSTFSSDVVLKLLAQQDASAAPPDSGYIQQLSVTTESSTGGLMVEMLCIFQPLYEMAVGSGGKHLDDEASLHRALSRCAWWKLCEPAAFAKHVKGKCTSQEFTQARRWLSPGLDHVQLQL